MDSILRQIFDGTLNPMETVFPEDPSYGPLWSKIEEEQTYLAQKLSPEDNVHLEQFDMLLHKARGLDIYAGFACGVRFGAGLCRELLEKTE